MSAHGELRSRAWFSNPSNPRMTAAHLERYLNYGLTIEELRSGSPIIGIAQSGSDLAPCNRHLRELAGRLRDGIISAGGVPLEFPVHPIQETGKRPAPALDRNLCYLGLVELLYGYPLDGVILTIGCDKTTPAQLMAAATVDIPAIAFSVGPMLNGWHNGKRMGSGTIVWEANKKLAAGEIDEDQFFELIASSTPSVGYCNTMGTASTMNILAEAIGMQLPGSAAIPAAYRERGQMAYRTGQRIVEMVQADRRPSNVITRESLLNAIVVNSAIGGSTNAPIHLTALARHLNVPLSVDEWESVGRRIPLLVNMQPAGEYLGEDFYRAGGAPAVIGELLHADFLHRDALTVTGRSLAEEYAEAKSLSEDVIRSCRRPLRENAGLRVLHGNFFESAIIKTSVIDDEFRSRYLSDPEDPDAFVARAVVFDGPEDYHARIDHEAVDERTILVIRGVGPVGYPGAPEVVNMQPPAALIREGVDSLPCLGDGRQSGTSGSPSILNMSPEAAVGGELALVETGDLIRVDLAKGRVDLMVGSETMRERRNSLAVEGGYPIAPDQTPWQHSFREQTTQLEDGMVLKDAIKFQRVAETFGVPRESH